MEDSREADSQEGDDTSSVLAFLAGITVAASGNEIWCVCLSQCVSGVVCLSVWCMYMRTHSCPHVVSMCARVHVPTNTRASERRHIDMRVQSPRTSLSLLSRPATGSSPALLCFSVRTFILIHCVHVPGACAFVCVYSRLSTCVCLLDTPIACDTPRKQLPCSELPFGAAVECTHR
jgi:hypothetical protein